MDALTFVLLVLLWCARIQENTGKFPRESAVASPGLFSKVPPLRVAIVAEKALC